ncbi:MAG TPA: ABC transporter permease subunit [Thermoleophilia bacterium]|nr:ABC transporter permease subunit [Thermoleophilia bacterium]
MFWNVFLAQQTKILKQRIVWIELVLLAGLVALISAAPYIVGDQNAAGSRNLSLTREVADLVATMGEATIGGLLVVILAGTATAQEYSWRSLHQWLSNGVSRLVFLGGKFASLLLPLVLIPATALVVATPVTAFFLQRQQGTLGSLTEHLPDMLLTVPLTAYALMPYAAMAVLLAVAGRSMATAIGGGLAFTLVVENLASQLLMVLGGSAAKLVAYLPSGFARGLLGSGPEGGPELFPAPVAAAGIAAYTALFFVAALWILRRQDLSD